MRYRSQVLSILLLLSMALPGRVFAVPYGSGNYGESTYGDPLVPATVIDNGPGLPIPQAKSCDASTPTSAPVLFQITPAKTSQTLYFTPATNADRYFIEYGPKSNSYLYGFEIIHDGNGVIAVTINALQANTPYYYKVRGGHGCATGEWSNELSAKTGSKPTYRWTALTPTVKSAVQKKIATQSVLALEIEAPTATLAPSPLPTPLPSPGTLATAPPVPPSPATGFWAFIKRLFGR